MASLLLLAAGSAAYAGEVVGQVGRFLDGDTLQIGATRIRFAGIDAPEMKTPEGVAARSYLVGLVGYSTLRCVDTGERSYERVVATCYLPGGQDVGASMVAAGWAVDWRRFSGGKYAGLQREARRRRVGAFADGRPPWRQ